MQITINTRHFDLTDSIRDYIESHINPVITKYFANPDDADKADITISKNGSLFDVEIKVHLARKMDVVTHGSAHDAYAAFDEALTHAGKKIRRHKRKITDYHKSAVEKQAMQALYYVIDSTDNTEYDEPEETYISEAEDEKNGAPAIIAEEASEIKSMSVSIAVASLDLSGRNAMLFKNSGNDKLSMVYMRPDGNIGWVEPHLD
ncbi:MAG: ribosome-associated translation inhibitor RaiA [Alphaproteobacteria bacterium]|nr:ribosome-associated translation inhibitor RaiA [Alphaproteobacteria bacterium]